jgi:Tfp pilus assembly protein PilN
VSVRVNLLPQATRARARAAQHRNLVGALGLLLLLALGATYYRATSQVRAAEDLLAAEQLRTAALAGEVAELAGFSELADRAEQSRTMLVTALGGEISPAGILQDLAAVVPADTQLETVNLQLQGPNELDPGAVGTLNVTGKTLTSHAPGVERVLLQLDKVVTFSDLYLNSSTLDDPDGRTATFSLDGRIGAQAVTGRYRDGLPEELR